MSEKEKIKITIDGKEIECYTNQTYYEVASENGFKIPTLCHHPELKPAGKCRVCVVVKNVPIIKTNSIRDVREK